GDGESRDAAPPDEIGVAYFQGRVTRYCGSMCGQRGVAHDTTSVERIERDPIQAHHRPTWARIVAQTAPWAEWGARLVPPGLYRVEGFDRLRSRTDGRPRTKSLVQTGIPMHPVVGRVGVGDTCLLPAHPRSRGGGLEPAWNQLATDGASGG